MNIARKNFFIIFFILNCVTASSNSQDNWKTSWNAVLAKLDSMFYREQAQFRLMQSYQNDPTEELILKDIDSLIVFQKDVNLHIGFANDYEFTSDADSKNASETIRLKIEGLKEYFEQCRLQIHVNNNILQRRLKNESLDFKVSQIDELKLNNYEPKLK